MEELEIDPEIDAVMDEVIAALGEAWPAERIVEALEQRASPPSEAFSAALAFPDRVAPQVIDALLRATRGETLSEAAETLMFRGLFVLGAARHDAGFQPLLQFLRTLGEAAENLLGDVTTDGLQRILAGMYDGDFERFRETLLHPGVATFARGAMFEALTTLVWKQRIGRGAAISLLSEFDRERREETEPYLWFAWSQVAALLGMAELAEAVEAAFADGRITPDISDADDFRAGLEAACQSGEDETRFEMERLGYVLDLEEELARFSFSAGEEDYGRNDLSGEPWDDIQQEPVRNPMRNVGRNDPCPCGSGRKYKKCCLNKE